jgi:hypothetical protein
MTVSDAIFLFTTLSVLVPPKLKFIFEAGFTGSMTLPLQNGCEGKESILQILRKRHV